MLSTRASFVHAEIECKEHVHTQKSSFSHSLHPHTSSIRYYRSSSPQPFYFLYFPFFSTRVFFVSSWKVCERTNIPLYTIPPYTHTRMYKSKRSCPLGPHNKRFNFCFLVSFPKLFFSGTIFVNPLRLVCGIDFYFSFTGHSTFFFAAAAVCS